MKLRQRKTRRYTHVTVELYREPVYRVVQDMLGYEEVPEPPRREALLEEYYENEELLREEISAEEYVDNAIDDWERAYANPEPIVSDTYLAPATFAELARANVPPSGATRAALRRAITQQYRQRRLTGSYEALKLRSYEGALLVMLDWMHADILDLEVSDPEVSQLVQSPHAFLRVAGPWVARGLRGRGRWHLRMGGSAKFFHPAGEGQKIVDRELHRDDRPQWLRALQESAMADVEA